MEESKKSVRYCITDERIGSYAVNTLCEEGYTPVLLPPYSALPAPTASHTDMLIKTIGRRAFLYRGYLEEHTEVAKALRTALAGYEITVLDRVPGKEYPADAGLNALTMARHVFLNKDAAAPEIIDAAAEAGLRVVHVNQGYPACTVLTDGGYRAITADPGMKKAIADCGYEVLGIDAGDILLPPYEYGFIGGCAGISRGRAVISGNLFTHRNGAAICSFLLAGGLTPLFLTDDPLLDVGGIFFPGD